MIISVGSNNPVKVQAVGESLARYQMFRGAKLFYGEAFSEVSEQPKSLEETITGAKNRARFAFGRVKGCVLSFGIESGLFNVPHTKTGMMDICACAVYGGEKYSIGLSSAFECPPRVMYHVLNNGMDLDSAFFKAGLTPNPRIGYSQGLVHTLTRGRVDRKEFTKQAIIMAMIQLENAELY